MHSDVHFAPILPVVFLNFTYVIWRLLAAHGVVLPTDSKERPSYVHSLLFLPILPPHLFLIPRCTVHQAFVLPLRCFFTVSQEERSLSSVPISGVSPEHIGGWVDPPLLGFC